MLILQKGNFACQLKYKENLAEPSGLGLPAQPEVVPRTRPSGCMSTMLIESNSHVYVLVQYVWDFHRAGTGYIKIMEIARRITFPIALPPTQLLLYANTTLFQAQCCSTASFQSQTGASVWGAGLLG